jgi:hypothetical protein
VTNPRADKIRPGELEKEIAMIEGKPWYRSKILWMAVLTIALGLIPLLMDLFKIIIPQSFELATAILTFISGALTLIFRVMFTNQPVV